MVTLILELSDEVFAELHREAMAMGLRPEDLAVAILEQKYGPPADVPFRAVGLTEQKRRAARERF